MNELGQIRTAVLTALKDAGIEALEQFPEEKIKAYTSAAATVGVGAASGKSAGFGDYLGEVTDAETQTVRERYGKELTGQIPWSCGRSGPQTARRAVSGPPRCF